jgi:AraC-like DNA-binding protein
MATSRNYFDYFPVAPQLKDWGCYATSFGTVKVAPGAAYPPPGHPGSHALAWERGRTLSNYQVIFLHEGSGRFESSHVRRSVPHGTAFVLFPGVWHRYRPNPKEGWTESWIEVKGPYFDQLSRSGAIDPHQCVFPLGANTAEVEALLSSAATMARFKPPGFGVQLGLVAAQILALLRWNSSMRRTSVRRMDQVISQAQALLTQDHTQRISLEQVAQKLGVGYSYFRHRFKAQTGLSPKQYRMDVRHHRVKNLLRDSDLTLKEIADQLNYSSAFHLSEEFSRLTGMAPQRWRRQYEGVSNGEFGGSCL